MLIIYREATGEVVENTGTNTFLPLGPPDDLAWGDRDRTGLALLRLHDDEDANLVAATFTHRVLVLDGQLSVGDRLPESTGVTPPAPPTGAWAAAADARIAALSAAMAAVMKTTTLPAVDDDVLGELDGLDPLPPSGGGQDLDDILSELEGL